MFFAKEINEEGQSFIFFQINFESVWYGWKIKNLLRLQGFDKLISFI